MRGPFTHGGLGAALITAALGLACGSSAPRESDIFHDPALRAGALEADGDAERALLTALADAGEGPVEVSGVAATPPYHAASGRRCRRISGGSHRLACQGDEGAWVFVPDVLSAEAR
ncbi:MAG: hypothetical protein VYE22_13095 [Myxococcota bacterium]|nr:hypothetical protein [Myxococcota bacterium]